MRKFKSLYSLPILAAIILSSCGTSEKPVQTQAPEVPVIVNQPTDAKTWTANAVEAVSTWTVNVTETGKTASTDRTMRTFDWVLVTTIEWTEVRTGLNFRYPATYETESPTPSVLVVKDKADSEKYLQFQFHEWTDPGEPFCATFESSKKVNDTEFKRYFTAESCLPVISEEGDEPIGPRAYTAYVVVPRSLTYVKIGYFWKDVSDFEEIIDSIKFTIPEVPLASSRFFSIKNGQLVLKWYNKGEYERVMDQADLATFKILSEDFVAPISKDKRYVYNGANILEWADPATFEMMNMYYAKDATHIYANNGDMSGLTAELPWVDMATFRITGDVLNGDLSAEDKNKKYWGYTVR